MQPGGPKVRDPSGRITLAVILAAAAAGGAALWLLERSAERWVAIWNRLGVPALLPTFADTRAYTAAWECDRAGIDVFVSNPCDPWQRTLIPPRLPAELGFLGLGESATVPLALTLIGLFLVSVFVVAGSISKLDALVYSAILLSPSVLLGIERGNTDLLVFALLTLLLVFVRSAGWTRAFAYGALLLAAMLKLYPLFASGVLLRQGPRRALEGCLAVLVPFAVYALLTWDDLVVTAENMSRSVHFSWGASVLPLDLGATGRTERLLVAAGLVGGLVLSAALAALWRDRPRSGAAHEARSLDAFWIGAGVYVGTFAVGNNYNYKLVCLIFVVPQLLRWTREAQSRVPAAPLALLATVATFWLGVETPIFPVVGDEWIRARAVYFHFEELLTWGLFVYLATALWLTLPQWLVHALAGRLRIGGARTATEGAAAS